MTIDQAAYERNMKLFGIFMPHAAGRRKEMIGAQGAGRFAYYTTADTAMKIVASRRLWLRDARCMNDWSEVRYGQKMIADYFAKNGTLDRLKAALDKCHPGTSAKVIELYNGWRDHIATSTFMCCVSEHGPLPGREEESEHSEDDYGRLSMWRAYGGRNAPGIAFVFKFPLNRAIPNLWVFLTPVAYLDQESFENEIERAILNIEANIEVARTFPQNEVIGSGYLMLAFAAVSIKHPGFHEEREWRIVHLPKQFKSEVVLPSLETVDGVPQTVYKLPMENRPNLDITGIDFSELLDRVIVGPTLYSDTIATALVTELKKAGVSDAERKIVRSTIPLRA